MISITSRTIAGILLVDSSLLEVQRLPPGYLLYEQLHSRQLDAVPPGQVPSYSSVVMTMIGDDDDDKMILMMMMMTMMRMMVRMMMMIMMMIMMMRSYGEE